MASQRKVILMTTLIACCCILLPELARGFSMGAPDSACASMLPGHGVKSQDTLSPFSIKLTPVQVQDNRRFVNVTIMSDRLIEFAGFLLQARPENGGNALGSFVDDPTISKTHTCGSGLKNSVTHNNKTPKKRVDIVWEAPENYEGVLVFNATIVRDYSTFWTGVTSEKFIVRRRSDGTDVEAVTTSRPTTLRVPPTTVAASTTPTRKLPVVGRQTNLYADCGVTKGCFGFPANCLTTRNCGGLVTYAVEAEKYFFELYTHDLVWVAVALSNDQQMGSDSVMECAYENGKINLYSSWNEAEKGGQHRIVGDDSLQLKSSSYENNEIYCKFTRPRITTVENVEFDLQKPYYLFVAAGPDFKDDSVGYHHTNKDFTAEKIVLSDASFAAAASKILIRLHGSFMLMAWIGTASCGILLARYFKQTWVGSQLCSKDQWFAWHRMLMVLTWCLTVAAFIIIFVELKAWSSAENPHAILGVITTALAFIQPFMAALRPHPGARRRPVFNWCHWLVGNLAHIFAIVTIFFAVLLPKAELPDWMNWILVAYVGFHVFMHLIFSIVGCVSDRQGSARVTAFPMKDMGSSRNALHAAPDRKRDAPYSTFRKVLLAIYIIGVFGLAIALIVITSLAPIEETWKDVKKMVGLQH